MKRARLLVFFLGFVAAAPKLRAQAPDYATLVSLWRLNGSVADSYGPNNGTFVGTTAYVAGPRTNTQAASLNGSSYIKAGTNFLFDRLTPFSATAWVKGASTGNDAAILGKMLHGGAYTGWELHVGTTAGGSGAGKLNLWLINNYGANYIQVNSPVVVLDGAWHHVAFTYDGSSLAAGVRIYVDGTNATGAATANNLTGTLLNTTDLDLGSRQNGTAHRFTGALHEASVWRTNLAPADINAIFLNGVNPSVLLASFAADRTVVYAGETVTLSWQADPLAALSLAPGIGDVTGRTTNGSGSIQVTLTTDTTFTLTATNASRPAETRQVTIGIRQPPLDALAHRYSFAGDATDSVRGSNGTPAGSATVSGGQLQLPGGPNGAAYLNLPPSIVNAPGGAVTLEFWVTFTNVQPWSELYSFGNRVGNSGESYLVFIPYAGGQQKGPVIGDGNGSPAVNQALYTPPAFVSEPPMHLAVVYDSGNDLMEFYTNGVWHSARSITFNLSDLVFSEGNLGRSIYRGDPDLSASVDEFRIYHAALTPADVAQSYALGPDTLPQAGPVNFVVQPQSVVTNELSEVTFSAVVNGSVPFAYQWLRNGVPSPGATNRTLTFVASPADEGAQFALAATNVFTNAVFVAISSNATLTVVADTNPPTVLWAQGRTLTGAQVKFSKPLRTETTTNMANLSLAGTNGALVISNATLSANGTLMSLTTEPQTFGATYTLTMNGVIDHATASNAVTPNFVSFAAVPFSTDNIGGDVVNGVLSVADGAYVMSARGAGVLATNDQLAFSFQPRDGDFDVRVRVAGLTTADVWSRASLVAREDTSASGRNVTAVATPTLAGCFLEWRDPVGAAFQRAGSFPPNFPNLWLRLRRVGNVFTAFAGTDGVGWFRLGDVTLALNTNVLLGFGVASATATPVTARLSDFGDNTSTTAAVLPDVEPPGPSSRHTPIAITEIHYHPAPRVDSNDVEFVELFNSNPWPEDLSGWRLTGDISFTFPTNTSMAGGSYLVVANAPADVTAVYGLTNVFGPYGNRLKSSGTVRLRNEQDAVMLEVIYDNKPPWPVASDGSGHSLVLRRPSYGEGDPRAWDQSDHVGGLPGRFDSVSADLQRGMVINEFLANSELPLTDFVELFNASGHAVDLSGAWLSDDPGTNKFRIPDGTVLAPGGYVSFDEATLGFALSSDGDEILLVNSNRTRVLDSIRFGAQAPNVSRGRTPDGGPLWSELAALTPDSTNSPLLQREIVINEIMFHPISGANDDEFVELFNRGTNAVDLVGWRLSGGMAFTFTNSVIVPPGGFAVGAANLTNLLAKYPSLTTANTFGNCSGTLANGGERIALQMPVTIVKADGLGGFVTNFTHATVNEVTYLGGPPWGRWSGGGGSSLELVDARADNRLPTNWADSDESTKAPWTLAEATGYLDFGSTYTNSPIDRLELTAMGAGEFLVDDVEVRQNNGPNLLADGVFESGLGAWVAQGNHIRSSASAPGAGYGVGFALHVRASGDGDTGANRIRVPLTSALTPGQVCTIRAKVRWLKGFPELVFRVRGNYHELFVRCELPSNLGTPGALNSHAVANAGPAIADVKFAPVLPAANEPIVVTARAYDPDGVASLALNWRADPSLNYTSVAMRDDGTGGDAVAGDGVFSATIPGQPAGTLVAWFLRAEDGSADFQSAVSQVFNLRGVEQSDGALEFPGASRLKIGDTPDYKSALQASGTGRVSVYPADAPANECLVRFGEPALASPFGTYRLWLTASNVSRWSNRPFLDNEPLPGTLVLGNFRAIQFAQGRYAGSPAHQTSSASPVTGPASFSFDLAADDPLLGSDSLQKLHAPGNAPGADTTLVAEPLQYQFLRRLGLPWMNLRHVAWLVNGNRQGLLLQDMETPNGDVVKSRFPSRSNGQLFRAAIRYEFDDVTATGATAAGVQWFGGVSHGAATLNNYLTTNVANGLLERKTAPFRWTFQPRAGRDMANDYAGLFALVDAATNAASAGLRALVNFDEWARHCAADHMAANWDSYGGENGQNMYFYKATDTTWRWLPFDRAIVFAGSTSYDLFVGHTYFPDAPFSATQAQPDFRRGWWAAYQELAGRWLAPEFFHPFLDTRLAAFRASGLNITSPDTTKSWLAARRSFILQSLASVNAPFAVATNYMESATNIVTLAGAAAPWVASITANGKPLSLRWTSVTNWEADFIARPGSNLLALAGFDRDGLAVTGAQASATVLFTCTNAWPALRINEWMADNTGFIRDPADNDAEDWFELFNPTPSEVNLAGWFLSDSLTNRTQFTVPGVCLIPAHGFLLVWADGEPGQNATNRADLHVNFKLDKDGEAIALSAPDGTLMDAVTFGPQTANLSEGRHPDGSASFGVLATPTPRETNAPPPWPPAFLSLEARGTNLTLVLQTEARFRYQVEYKDDLAQPLWTPLGVALTATTNSLKLTDTLGASPQRFYRVTRTP